MAFVARGLHSEEYGGDDVKRRTARLAYGEPGESVITRNWAQALRRTGGKMGACRGACSRRSQAGRPKAWEEEE